MYRYIVKRLLLAVPTLAGAAALVFVLMRAIPGDVCVIRLGSGGAHVDPASVAACRQELGLDDPLIVQFLRLSVELLHLQFRQVDVVGQSGGPGDPAASAGCRWRSR